MKNNENFKTLSREELKQVKGGIHLTYDQVQFLYCISEAAKIENVDARAIMMSICAQPH